MIMKIALMLKTQILFYVFFKFLTGWQAHIPAAAPGFPA